MRNLPWGLLAVFLITSAFFIPHWLAGNLFGTFDLSHITAPIEDIFARYQAAGEIPIWAREFQAGFPLTANGFQSFFYLPHLLLRIWLPGIWLTNISLLLHIWLAAAGMWLLLRQHKFSSPVATLGVLFFASSGYFIGRVTLPHLFFPATWIPLILWALFRLWRQPNIANAALFAVIYAAQIFSGHIQMAIYTGMMIGIAALILSLRNIRPVLWLLGAAFTVWLLTAAHILPTQELLPLSRRAAPTTQEEAFDVSYPPQHLLTWLKPDYFGRGLTYHGAKNEPELMMYFGVSGLLLGLTGIMNKKTWREPLGRASLGVIFVGVMLAGGEYSPVFRWLHSLPTPLAHLANPGRAIIFTHLGWCILATYGAAWLLARRILSTRSLYALAGVAALELYIAGWPVNPVVPAAAWAKPPAALAHLPARVEAPRTYSQTHIIAHPDTDYSPTVGPKLQLGFRYTQTLIPQRDVITGVDAQLTWDGRPAQAGYIKLAVKNADGQLLRESNLAGAAISDQRSTHFSFTPLPMDVNQPFQLEFSANYDSIHAPHLKIATDPNFNPTGKLTPGKNVDAIVELVYTQAPIDLDRELLLPLLGESFGIEMVRGHLTLQSMRMYKYLYELGERGDFVGEKLVEHRDMLDRLSVGSLVSSYPEHRSITGLPKLTLVNKLPAGQRDVHVYKNNQAYPIMGFARQVISVPDPDTARHLLVAGQVPPDAVVAESFTAPSDLAADKQPSLELIQRTSRVTRLRTRSTSPQFLIVRDAMFPGWQAAIDNQPTQIYYIDSLFQGVAIPPGEHEVILQYHSKPFIIGAWLSGPSWIIAGITIGLWYNFTHVKLLLPKVFGVSK